jgi:hypothetical protein
MISGVNEFHFSACRKQKEEKLSSLRPQNIPELLSGAKEE